MRHRRYGHQKSIKTRNARCKAPSADLPSRQSPRTCFFKYWSQNWNALPSYIRLRHSPSSQYSLNSYQRFGRWLLGSFRLGTSF